MAVCSPGSTSPLERPALQRLLKEVETGNVDVIIVYKVDRLTRSLADFAKLVELFDKHGVSFSVTQQFNTTNSMGLTLNVLLSFAQFEREVTGERIPGQDRSLEEEGHLDGRPRPARIRGLGQEASGAPDRSGAGAYHLQPLPRA